jgi:hypothetical protein
VIDSASQRVNRAVAIAVRRSVDSATHLDNPDAYAIHLGKRIQGTYGAEVRRRADLEPDLTAEELYALVIVPAEFPWDTEAARDAAGMSNLGTRDAARQRRHGPIFDPNDPDLTPPEDIPERVAELRRRLAR